MKKKSNLRSAFFRPRVLVALLLCAVGLSLALLAFGVFSSSSALAQVPEQPTASQHVQVGRSYKNDISPAARDLPDVSARDSKKAGT